MTAKVGVVCEGSHDFTVIKELVQQICIEQGIDLLRFDCLQPALSATFEQIGGGGWGRVKAWCEDNGGKGYEKFLDAPLFATSISYDFLIVHLDGDVLDICEAPPLAGKSTTGLQPSDVVTVLESAILQNWLSLDPRHVGKITCCIPVLHLEAWLMAALDPTATTVEDQSTKLPFREKFAPNYPRKNKDLYQQAAVDAAKLLAGVRAKCSSFNTFEAGFINAAS